MEQSGCEPKKKSYHAPVLHSFGTISELTLTQPAGPNFDGGSGANIYAS